MTALGNSEINRYGQHGLDFRPPEDPFPHRSVDMRHLLVPGLKLVFKTRLHWVDRAVAKSVPLYVEASFKQEFSQVDVPTSPFHPNKNLQSTRLPLFNVSAGCNDNDLDSVELVDVGAGAIAYLTPRSYPGLFGFDQTRLRQSFDIGVGSRISPFLGPVKENSIYSIKPATD